MKPVPATADSKAPAGVPAGDPPPGWLAGSVIAIGIAYALAYVVIALLRMRFPFELEWMEGATLGHVERVLHGLPLYPAPSLDFTPFIYPPLYYEVAAWVARLVGAGFMPLRLVSFTASLGCLGLIAAYVRPASNSRWPGVLAACLFAATFRQGGAWFDLGRVDSLFLCLLLAGAVALKRIESPWPGGLAGGVLFALSALTKQSALLVAVPIALALLATDWRRGLAFAAVCSALFGACVLALDHQTAGWFRFYVFELPRDHPVIGQLLRGFWTQDLLGPLAIALVIGMAHVFVAPVRPRTRPLGLDAALFIGLVLTGFATRIRVGSYINVAIPAYLGVSLLFGLGIAALWTQRRPASGAARRAEAFVALLVLAQFAVLAYKPWQQIPTAADRAAGEQIVESLRRVPGEVWVPRHPYLAAMAGRPWLAHELALQDVLRATRLPQSAALLEKVRDAARARRFTLLVLDDETWIHHEFQPTYRLSAQMFGAGETQLFWPRTGFVTRPDFVWMPKPDSVAGPGHGGL